MRKLGQSKIGILACVLLCSMTRFSYGTVEKEFVPKSIIPDIELSRNIDPVFEYEHREKEDVFNKLDDPHFNPKEVAPKKTAAKSGEYGFNKDNFDEKLEFKTILNYIKDKFKKINNEEAEEISEHLVQSGKEHEIDPKFAAALIARESAFNKNAVSRTGAKGLGQIKDFNFKGLKIVDPFNIKENVAGTTQYIKEMMTNWESVKQDTKPPKVEIESELDRVKLALASYFKGFGAVKREGMDPASNKYADDILKYYNDIASYKEKSSL